MSPGTHGSVTCYGAAGPFLVSETRHSMGQRIGHHDHAEASLNFVLEGRYGETFRSRKESHRPDTLVFKPAEATHANHFDESPARCLLIEIQDDGLRSILRSKTSRLQRVTRDPRLSVLAVRILREARARDDVSSLIIEELSATILSSMHDEPTVSGSTIALRAEEFLRETYREPWSLGAVARAIGAHPAHLGRTFRARFGCTLGEFVRHLRVLQVSRELQDSDKPIAQIALEAGFADQSHCTRVFRSLVHDSPGRFRAFGIGRSVTRDARTEPPHR